MPSYRRHIDVALDLAKTFTLQQVGRHDPTTTLDGTRFAKTYLTGGQVVRVTIARAAAGCVVEVESEAELDGDPCERWAAELERPLASFDEHVELARLARQVSGLRLARVPWLFDTAASFVLQQRITFKDAARAWRRIAERWGVRSDLGLAFPDAKRMTMVTLPELQAMDIDARRARALLAVAREEVFARFLRDGTPRDTLRKRLASIHGIGPWTTEMVLGYGTGDADAVPTGDLHLPSFVTEALAGEIVGTDERMLELLEPFRPHRFLAIRLLWAR
ncbi:MAG: DNA-3-methyladenine glycosylase family protein [Kofleriaceae bacterium]